MALDLAHRRVLRADLWPVLIDVLVGHFEAERILGPAAHVIERTALRAAARPERDGHEKRDKREQHCKRTHGFLPFQGMRVHALQARAKKKVGEASTRGGEERRDL